MSQKKSYTELCRYSSYKDRFEYLKLDGRVGVETFGINRYLNQTFYRSREWRNLRHSIIVRDLGCDLGVDGYDIYKRAVIHHINPLTEEMLRSGDPAIMDPDNLITVLESTHKAIHYGDTDLLLLELSERSPNDMCPWKGGRYE